MRKEIQQEIKILEKQIIPEINELIDLFILPVSGNGKTLKARALGSVAFYRDSLQVARQRVDDLKRLLEEVDKEEEENNGL